MSFGDQERFDSLHERRITPRGKNGARQVRFCRFRIGAAAGRRYSFQQCLEPSEESMWLRFVFGLVLAFGLVETAAAQGPAGSTGAIASIPGSIVRWQPGDPVPPPGLFTILTSPSLRDPPPPQPVGRETKVRKQ